MQWPHVIAHIVLMYHPYWADSQKPSAFHARQWLPGSAWSSAHGLSAGILPLTEHSPLQPSTASLVSVVTLNSVALPGCEQWIVALNLVCAQRRGSTMQLFIVMHPSLFAWVGGMVGGRVGGLVGANEGVSVGTSVGLIGESVGVRLGAGVGVAVGVCEGLGDGECVVGENVGV